MKIPAYVTTWAEVRAGDKVMAKVGRDVGDEGTYQPFHKVLGVMAFSPPGRLIIILDDGREIQRYEKDCVAVLNGEDESG